MPAYESKPLIDFSSPEEPARWLITDDGVMGGISHSHIQPTAEGHMLFTGEVSLEHNGGFSSVNRLPAELNLSGFLGIMVCVKGDGKTYSLRLKTVPGLGSMFYQLPFSTCMGEWQELSLPFSEFVPRRRGHTLVDAPPLDLSSLQSIGMIIADKQPGPFALELSWIKVYR